MHEAPELLFWRVLGDNVLPVDEECANTDKASADLRDSFILTKFWCAATAPAEAAVAASGAVGPVVGGKYGFHSVRGETGICIHSGVCDAENAAWFAWWDDG